MCVRELTGRDRASVCVSSLAETERVCVCELTGRDSLEFGPVGVNAAHLHLHQRRTDPATRSHQVACCHHLCVGGRMGRMGRGKKEKWREEKSKR